jgi:hypothetical protein
MEGDYIMIGSNSKSILARLLAKENVEVIHGNYKTAFFDVERRVLGLPLWDNLPDVYDLLVGHEVGHALETPPEGWHDAEVEIPGCPRSYLNVVEDVRIEKKIQRRYPGLVSCFKRGYQKLYDDDFFGINQIPEITPDYVNLIDRINIKAKLRGLVQVKFTSNELPLVNEVFAVETWEDVLEACKKLYAYALENSVQKSPSIPNFDSKMENNTNEEEIDPTADYGQANAPKPRSLDDTSEDQEKAKPSPTSSDEEGEKEDERSVEESNQPSSEGGKDFEQTPFDPTDSVTDKAFRDNEHKLISKGAGGDLVRVTNGFSNKQIKDMIIDFNTIQEARSMQYDERRRGVDSSKYYDDFINENKKIVQIMAKEFEMRKAAWRTVRAQTARSGSLDVNKLYAYKYTDDIFKRMTNLPDAKNHGMFMMVDYSGSMQATLGSVIKQVCVLSMFCKKVNIPFEVYGFTTRGNRNRSIDIGSVPYGNIAHQDVKLMHLISSSMNKTDQESALKGLLTNSFRLEYGIWPTQSSEEDLGGTPLNEALIAAPLLIKEFASKHNIEKTNFILLTDGCGGRMDIRRHEKEEPIGYSNGGVAVNVQGRLVRSVGENKDLTKALLTNLKHHCSSVTGYFLANGRYDFNYAVGGVRPDISYDDSNNLRREFMRNKFTSFDNVGGYDRFFILRNDRKSLDTSIDEFEVRDGAKKSEIARAFRKHSASKKANRTLAVKFAETVA